MKISFRFTLTLLTFLAVSLNANTAKLDIGLGIKAEAGITEDTRVWINSLLPQARKEVLLLLEDALPLIDKSVLTYLDKVDAIIASNVTNARCEVKGIIYDTYDAFKKAFFGIEPKPIKKQLERWDDFDFKKRTSIDKVVVGYADFAVDAESTYCYVKNVNEASPLALLIRAQVSRRAAIWSRLQNKCSSFNECFDYMKASNSELLASSDQRDLDTVNAIELSEQIQKPLKPKRTFFKSNFSFRPYEDQFLLMFHINDAVELAKNKRISNTEDTDAEIKSLNKLITTFNAERQDYARQIDYRRSKRHSGAIYDWLVGMNPKVRSLNSRLSNLNAYETEQIKQIADLKVSYRSLTNDLRSNIKAARHAVDYIEPRREPNGPRW